MDRAPVITEKNFELEFVCDDFDRSTNAIRANMRFLFVPSLLQVILLADVKRFGSIPGKKGVVDYSDPVLEINRFTTATYAVGVERAPFSLARGVQISSGRMMKVLFGKSKRVTGVNKMLYDALTEWFDELVTRLV